MPPFWAIVTQTSPPHWDDGFEKVIAPFWTEELAKDYAARHSIVGAEIHVIEEPEEWETGINSLRQQ